jgi:hypothetical protein
MDVDKSISTALGIDFDPADPKNIEIIPPNQVATVETKKKEVEVIVDLSCEAQEDFALIRTTMRALIEKGNEKLVEMGDLSKTLDTPRAYEVFGNMLEKVSGVANDLYDLHKKKKDLATDGSPRRPVDDNGINIDKAVFVGHTSDLLKELRANKKE